MTEPLLALLGPTASGKTEASLRIAPQLDAEIVSVDSMLLYRGMDVGTAKPTPEQRSRVPHHLIDLFDPAEPVSVSTYQALARDAVARIMARGRTALLVGSGGLYYRSVVDGLAFPATDPMTRRLLEAEAGVIGGEALYRRLSDLDPAAAEKIEPANVRRTVRALEVMAIAARRFSSFALDWERYPADAVRAAGVHLPNASLHRRIEDRAEAMIGDLLEETEVLLARRPPSFLTATQAIGYAEAVACLQGRSTREEAVALIVRRTKALARRQMAWLRRDPRIVWFDAGEGGAAAIADDVARYMERARVGTEAGVPG
jgi:tRNA dimethylallyltransferase